MVIDQGHVIAEGTPTELKDRVGGHVVEIHTAEPQDAERAAAVLLDFADDSGVHHEQGRALATITTRAASRQWFAASTSRGSWSTTWH